MERNNTSSCLQEHITGDKAMRECDGTDNKNNDQNSYKKLKDSWNQNSNSYEDDYLSGFLWPPRSYTCSFCKREFKSAQALGGHMNVHRRDRARLRQSPRKDGQYPFLNLNINPNLTLSSSAMGSPPFSCTLPSLVSLPLSSLSSPSSLSPRESKKWSMEDALIDTLSPKGSDLSKMKNAKSFFEVKELHGFIEEDGCKFVKKGEILRLDLEIGLHGDSKKDLDLELRLGYS